MINNKPQHSLTIVQQISYRGVRSSLMAVVAIAAVMYIALIIMSTVTLTHSKALVQDIQTKQDAITRLNGDLAAKNQTLAEAMKTSDLYTTPTKTAFINRADILTPALALEQ